MPVRAAVRRRESGFTMLEILITLLIMSIGLLGIAGLQAYTLKNTNSSNLRSIAVRQAYDLADRMRANQTILDAGGYNNESGAEVASCYQAAGCQPAQMARMDVFLWNENNARLLPGGKGYVCTDSTPNDGTPTAPACDNTPGAPYVLKTWWDEREASGELQRFVFAFRP